MIDFDNPMSKMSKYERAVYIYGVSQLYYVISGMGIKTLAMFADEVEKAYDKDIPQIKEVCRIFRKYSDENPD